MHRSAACFCILLLLIGSVSALPLNPSVVKVSKSPTTIQKATQVVARPVPVSCGENAVNCNGKCTNINFDEMNCGTCGMTCFDPAVCCNGKCVDLKWDEMNCGACGGMCFAPAKCCMGICEEDCPYAETGIIPAVPVGVATPPAVGMVVATTTAVGMAVVTSPGQPAVQGVSGAIISLPSTPHTLITLPYRNMTAVTLIPQSCPTSEWSCMPLAQAAAQFGYPYIQYGNVPCGYTMSGGQTVAEYCCRAVPGGSISPVSLGATGIKSTDPGLHIINRTRVNATAGPGQAKVNGKLIEQRADFISAIFSFFGGFLAKPVPCGEGAVNCNGKCSDINFDETNCGTCGMTCFDPAVCCNGQCVELQFDDTNCGTCGMTCFLPATCCFGSCEDTCPGKPVPMATVEPVVAGMETVEPVVAGMETAEPVGAEVATPSP